MRISASTRLPELLWFDKKGQMTLCKDQEAVKEVEVRGDECQLLLLHQAMRVQDFGAGSRGDLQSSAPHAASWASPAPPVLWPQGLGGTEPKALTAAVWVKFNPLKNRDYFQCGSVSHWDLQGHPAGRQPSPLEVAIGLLTWVSWHPPPLPQNFSENTPNLLLQLQANLLKS